jgi:hypothetical protein
MATSTATLTLNSADATSDQLSVVCLQHTLSFTAPFQQMVYASNNGYVSNYNSGSDNRCYIFIRETALVPLMVYIAINVRKLLITMYISINCGSFC